MAGQLTEKQQQILDYIKSEILQKGYPPSVREICIAVHLKSTSSVHAHLSSLEEKGYIRRDPTKPRTIEVIDDAFALTRREMTNVPIIGTITAGEPILAQENIEDYFPIPVEYLPNAVVFMLRVRGDSMINAGIYNGDTVIVEQRSTAKNGDMVVAMIDDSATVKTFYKENGHYRLQPENDTMEPIICDHVEILGKVIGLLRMDM
ncbi:transcriptional repressor LexA [Frisingicoccus sp.]|uniref:transcriptional repressor LexA n=1 Tax=Frisingicoccus sp. TaxID=1918627 RepID=UPI003AB2AA5C